MFACLMVAVVCISLMTDEDAYKFICSFATDESSLVMNCLFSFAYSKTLFPDTLVL